MTYTTLHRTRDRRAAWGAIILIGLAQAGLAQPAASQESIETAQVLELPPVIVEGATIEAKTRKAPQASPAEASSTGGTAPTSQSASSSAGSGAGTSAGVPDVVDAAEAGVDDNSQAALGRSTSEGGIEARKVGTALSVVTGDELRAQKIAYVADALRSLPGVYVNRTGGTSLRTQVRIRGAEGNHTLVLIDGIEANDTMNGEFDFSELSTEDIERIEVLRGGHSGLYGSGAVGGVINIITRSGRGPLTFSSFAEGGSFRTRAGGVRASAGNERIWGSISYSGRESDGFNVSSTGNEDDGARLTTFNLRSGVQIAPGLILDLSLRQVREDGDRDTDDFLTGRQTDAAITFAEDTWLGGMKLTWDTFGGALTQVARISRSEAERSDTDPVSLFFTGNRGVRTTYAYQATGRFKTGPLMRHALTGFIDHEEETFVSTSFSANPFFPFPADGRENVRRREGYAVEYQGEFAERLFVTGVVRRDDNDSFEDFTTWRTSVSLDLVPWGLRPHASVGTAVKFPTMFEQFGTIPGFFTPNPDLKPEESFGWDAGIEFHLMPGRLIVDATYFEADLENKIDGFFFPVNLAGISERRGIELSGRFAVSREVTLGAAYTWLDATDPDGPGEIRRAPHSGRFDVNYVFANGAGNLNLAAIYNGEMLDKNFATFPASFVTLEDYWLVNAAASYKVMPGVELYGRVENLLNQNYEEVFGFETADIAAYVGVRLTYEEAATRTWAEGR